MCVDPKEKREITIEIIRYKICQYIWVFPHKITDKNIYMNT